MLITRRLSSMPVTAFPTTRVSAVTCTAIAMTRSRFPAMSSGRMVNAANGMVMDFEVKALARQHVVDVWDHAFLVYAGDAMVLDFRAASPTTAPWCFDCVPTAENLAAMAFRILDPVYRDTYGNQLRLAQVRPLRNPQLPG